MQLKCIGPDCSNIPWFGHTNMCIMWQPTPKNRMSDPLELCYFILPNNYPPKNGGQKEQLKCV